MTTVQKDSWSDWLLVQILIRLRWGGFIAMPWFARATRHFKPIRVNIKPSFLRARLDHFPISLHPSSYDFLGVCWFLFKKIGFYLKKNCESGLIFCLEGMEPLEKKHIKVNEKWMKEKLRKGK
ncbi:hypothetical protein Hanom_Chr07g00585361 [Helianthus anomalus]